MNIAETFADELDYSGDERFGDERFPRITGIRNVRRVKAEKHHDGYTFVFEACVGGEWVSYGPEVYGNWSVRSGLTFRFPDAWRLENGSTETVYIGWFHLNRVFGELPLEES